MKSEVFSEYLCLSQSADMCNDGFTITGQHGHCIIGRLVRHGRLWFAKGYNSSTDITEAQLRLKKEFEILMMLNYPDIVKAGWIEINETVGTLLVLEYIDGKTLSEFITNANKLERRLIAESLIKAVAYMHRQGVMHLDLKPENILVIGTGRNLRIKIIDFGMAQTTSSVIFNNPGGTPGFSDPMQFAANYEPSPVSDVYAVGRLLDFIQAGYIYKKITKKAVSNSLIDRPADGGALLSLRDKYRRIHKLALILPPVLLLISAIYIVSFSFITKDNNSAAPISQSQINAATTKVDSTGAKSASEHRITHATATISKPSTPQTSKATEYEQLKAAWLKQLEKEADKMTAIARDRNIPAEQRRSILEQMNDSLLYATMDYFRPYVSSFTKEQQLSHPMSWCTYYEPEFQSARSRMSAAYFEIQ